MRILHVLAAVSLFSFLQACVCVVDPCDARSCNGCCNSSNQCVGGSSNNECGNGGNTCAVCPATFTCSLGSCQPGATGGGSGGGFGGGTGGGFGGGTGGGTTAQPGDIIFVWNFSGQSCAVRTDVQSVRVTIPGQTLQNGGVYGCNNAGSDGIRLLNFAAGSYGYTLEALSASGAVLFQKADSVVVNGNVTVNATLTPVSSSASALISWTFPPNGASSSPNCSQAGVITVNAIIDSAAPLVLQCTDGFGGSVRVDNLSAGLHSLELAAADSNAFVYYRKTTNTLAATSGTPAQNTFLFDWAVGSLPLKWSFNNGVTMVSCAAAGVTMMNINLRDSAGNDVYGTTGVDVPCVNTGSIQGTEFPYLYGDTYSIYLQAYGTGGVLYHTNLTSPPTATVVNGQFPVLSGTTPIHLLTL